RLLSGGSTTGGGSETSWTYAQDLELADALLCLNQLTESPAAAAVAPEKGGSSSSARLEACFEQLLSLRAVRIQRLLQLSAQVRRLCPAVLPGLCSPNLT